MTKIVKLDDTLKGKPIKDLIKMLSSEDPNIKFSSSRVLIDKSEHESQKLYPYFDEFVRLTESQNKIIIWTGIIIIGNLAKIDNEGKIERILPKIFSLLNTGVMITAGNAIAALAKIALAMPGLKDRITTSLLKVERYSYDTLECKRIAIGHVIAALETYKPTVDKFVFEFAQRAAYNERPSTAKKAEKFLVGITHPNK